MMRDVEIFVFKKWFGVCPNYYRKICMFATWNKNTSWGEKDEKEFIKNANWKEDFFKFKNKSRSNVSQP